MRRLHVGVARHAHRRAAHLIGQQQNDIWSAGDGARLTGRVGGRGDARAKRKHDSVKKAERREGEGARHDVGEGWEHFERGECTLTAKQETIPFFSWIQGAICWLGKILKRAAVLVAFIPLNFSAAFNAAIAVPTFHARHEIIDTPAGIIVVCSSFSL